jgi:hypothetical protein
MQGAIRLQPDPYSGCGRDGSAIHVDAGLSVASRHTRTRLGLGPSQVRILGLIAKIKEGSFVHSQCLRPFAAKIGVQRDLLG